MFDIELYAGPCDGAELKIPVEPVIGESILVPVKQQDGSTAHYKYGGNGIAIFICQNQICEKW